MQQTTWPILQPDLPIILAGDRAPLEQLAEAEIAAIVIRQAFDREACRSLVDYFIDQGLMFTSGDYRIDEKAIPVDRVDRWTKQGLNPAGCIHEVPGIEGDLPRIVLATFIGYSPDEDEIMVWS